MIEYRKLARFPHYLIGSDGAIWREGRAQPMKQRLKGNGYLDVPLCEGGRYYTSYAHRIVCEAFHGEPPFKFECRHKNGVRTDNRADNLSWASHTDNEADKKPHGTKLFGEKNYNSILSEEDVMTARLMAIRGVTDDDIAERFGVHRVTASNAVTGKNWKHLPGPVKRGRWPAVTSEEARKADLLPTGASNERDMDG